MGWNKITNGLFPYKPKFCWRNIRNIPNLFQRIGYVLKHGYSPIARWDYIAWFIDTTKDIFEEYMKYHVGYKIIDDTKAILEKCGWKYMKSNISIREDVLL